MAAAKILSVLAVVNYYIQGCSTEDFKEASEQAEMSSQVIEQELNTGNFLNGEHKNIVALIKGAKADAGSGKEKAKLLDEARRLEGEVLAIHIANLGEHNPDTATTMSNLGVTYMSSGRIAESEQLMIKTLTIRERILGEDSAVATSHFELGVLYDEHFGDHERAKNHFEKCIAIREKIHGLGFSELGNHYDWLLFQYQQTGEHEKEDELEKKKMEWKKMQDEKKMEEGGDERDEDKQMQKDMTLEELINFVTTNDDTEEPEV